MSATNLLPRKTLLLAGLLLAFAGAAEAASYTVTLANGTSFETRYRPRTAEWDKNFALFRTETGTLIAVKKSEITDIVAASEVSGFGFQVNETTTFLGWSPNEALEAEEAAAAAADGGTAAAAAAGAAAGAAAAAAASDSGSGFSVQQFVDIPADGVLPGGFGIGTEQGGGS
jgi:hypothetical protein